MTERKTRGKKAETVVESVVESAAPPPVTEPAVASGRKPDYLWSGKPAYRCSRKPGCQYERVENLEAVLRHEESHQPPPARTDGKPLKVEGDRE